MTLNKIILFFCSLGMLVFMYYTANNTYWKFHLESDIRTFYDRYTEFDRQKSFSGFGKYEYLPGSLFFFIFPAVGVNTMPYAEYLNYFILINIFLVGLHLILFKKFGKLKNSYLPLILLLSIGPILLFRFELFVSLFFLLSIYFLGKNKYLLSGIFLGVSVMIKAYPIFILPYIVILLIKKGFLTKTFAYLLGFLIGIIIPVVLYVGLGGYFTDPITNLIYHAEKPIMIESLFGSITSITALIKDGALPSIAIINGVWGMPTSMGFPLMNLVPYAVLIFSYIYLLFTAHKNSVFSIRIPILILLSFLFFSKYLNPQYLFWSLGLLPLLTIQKNWWGYIFIINTVFVLVLTQITYPIYFSQLLEAFNSGSPNFTFYLIQIRNVLVFIEILFLIFPNNFIEENGQLE